MFPSNISYVFVFSVAPAWSKPSIDTLGEDINVLIQFWNALMVDRKHMESFAISNSLDSVLETPDEHSSLPSVTDLARYDSAGQVLWLLFLYNYSCVSLNGVIRACIIHLFI